MTKRPIPTAQFETILLHHLLFLNLTQSGECDVAAAAAAAVVAVVAVVAKIQPNQESDVGAALSILIWFALTIALNETRTWCVF